MKCKDIIPEIHRLHQMKKGFMNLDLSGLKSPVPFQGNLSEFPPYPGSMRGAESEMKFSVARRS